MRTLLDWLTILFSPVCAAATTGAPVAVIGYETWCALDCETPPPAGSDPS